MAMIDYGMCTFSFVHYVSACLSPARFYWFLLYFSSPITVWTSESDSKLTDNKLGKKNGQ